MFILTCFKIIDFYQKQSVFLSQSQLIKLRDQYSEKYHLDFLPLP